MPENKKYRPRGRPIKKDAIAREARKGDLRKLRTLMARYKDEAVTKALWPTEVNGDWEDCLSKGDKIQVLLDATVIDMDVIGVEGALYIRTGFGSVKLFPSKEGCRIFILEEGSIPAE